MSFFILSFFFFFFFFLLGKTLQSKWISLDRINYQTLKNWMSDRNILLNKKYQQCLFSSFSFFFFFFFLLGKTLQSKWISLDRINYQTLKNWMSDRNILLNKKYQQCLFSSFSFFFFFFLLGKTLQSKWISLDRINYQTLKNWMSDRNILLNKKYQQCLFSSFSFFFFFFFCWEKLYSQNEYH